MSAHPLSPRMVEALRFFKEYNFYSRSVPARHRRSVIALLRRGLMNGHRYSAAINEEGLAVLAAHDRIIGAAS